MKVKELLAKPENWCKGTFAMDDTSTPTGYNNVKASRWCLTGAIFKCCVGDGLLCHGVQSKLLNAVRNKGYGSIARFNDHSEVTHEDVINLLNELNI